MEEIKSIRISELKDFKNHPFHVQQDIELCALMKSIEDEGVIVPLLVRPNPDGEGYEVIAGHRRKAGHGAVPPGHGPHLLYSCGGSGSYKRIG